MAERFAIERRGSIHHLHAVVRRRPLFYVLHADEFRIPLMRREKNFLVIIAGIVFGFDVEEAKLSGVQAAAQIFAGEGMGVIPAGSAGLRGERILTRTSRGHHRRPFFHRAVDFRRHVEAVPMHELGNVAVVVYVHDDSLAFLHAQQRSRCAAVVAGRLEDQKSTRLNSSHMSISYAVFCLKKKKKKKKRILYKKKNTSKKKGEEEN